MRHSRALHPRMAPGDQEPVGIQTASVGRRLLASLIDGAITLALAAAAVLAWNFLAAPLSGRSPSLGEMLFPLALFALLYCGLGSFFSSFEMIGGTIGQRLAGVRHVRPDGSPMRAGDWLYRHWPSFVSLAFFAGAYLLVWLEPRLPTTKMAIRWLTVRMTALAIACLALMILGYALARLRPRTLIVQATRGRRRGFDVVLSSSSEDSP